MHFDIEVEARLRITPEANYNSGWANLREQLREALTVVVPATPDKSEYTKCLGSFNVGPYPNYKSADAPRGFLPFLKTALDQAGHNWTIIDKKQYNNPVDYGKPIKLKPHQEDAVNQIVHKCEGIIWAPPAAGKTVLTLEAIRRLGQRSLIIVDKKNLVAQWQARCQEFLGLDVDIIAEGESRMSPSVTNITIAMQQTLASKFQKNLDYDLWGFVCLDECHHVSADTYLDVMERFSAEYRIGLSATPYRDDGLELISKLVIGPIIYKITSEQLQDGKHILKPEIKRHETHFEHDFWSTHYVTKDLICDKPGCRKNGTAHSHRNNYQAVTKALIENPKRNFFIARVIAINRHKCNLIVSDRLAHLNILRDMAIEQGFLAERTHMLTGKETPKEREEVVRLAGYGSCAIFSTIAKEALDIPRLDRLHLVWPIRKDHILEQQIGRITRMHPDKPDALVLDYVDEGCSILNSQAYSRFKYYKEKNYNVN